MRLEVTGDGDAVHVALATGLEVGKLADDVTLAGDVDIGKGVTVAVIVDIGGAEQLVEVQAAP